MIAASIAGVHLVDGECRTVLVGFGIVDALGVREAMDNTTSYLVMTQ